MTNILISYNPFEVKTEILIDDVPIAATSKLHKYIKTPMQDWVSELLPLLMEHCNDDELEITFTGIQCNYDDLKYELSVFQKKNVDCEIELSFDSRKSQSDRNNEFNSVIEEMHTQNIIEEFHSDTFWDSLNNHHASPLQVIILGIASTSYQEFVDDLLDGYAKSNDGTYVSYLSSGKSVQYYVIPEYGKCSREQLDFAIKMIASEKQTIVVCLLDAICKKNNTEIIQTISEQYRNKGSHNKRRFIFVAEDPINTRKMLKDEYSVKTTSVHSPDDILAIKARINEYYDEVYLIRQLKTSVGEVLNGLQRLNDKISKTAEQNKICTEVDQLERMAVNLLHKTKLISSDYNTDSQSKNSRINNFFNSLSEEYFIEIALAHDNAHNALTSQNAFGFLNGSDNVKLRMEIRRNIHDIIAEIPEKIRKFLITEMNSAISPVRLDIPSAFWTAISNIGCAVKMQNTIKSVEDVCNNLGGSSIAFNDGSYLNQIQELYIDIPGSKQSILAILEPKEVRRKLNTDGTYKVEYPFYYWLENQCARCIDYKFEAAKKVNLLKTSKDVFRTSLDKIRPILLSYMEHWESVSQNEMVAKKMELSKQIVEIEQIIHKHANELREEAEISDKEKRKLEYIDQLQSKLNNIISL